MISWFLKHLGLNKNTSQRDDVISRHQRHRLDPLLLFFWLQICKVPRARLPLPLLLHPHRQNSQRETRRKNLRETGIDWLILLMEEILHQLIGSLSHYSQGFIHPSSVLIGWFKLIPSILPLHSSNNCSDSSHTWAFWSPAFDSPSKLLVVSMESWDHFQLERAWRLVLGSNAKDIRQATNSWHLAGCSRHKDCLKQTNADNFMQ